MRLVITLFLLVSGPAIAKYYKCSDESGNVSYSILPCPNNVTETTVHLPGNSASTAKQIPSSPETSTKPEEHDIKDSAEPGKNNRKSLEEFCAYLNDAVDKYQKEINAGENPQLHSFYKKIIRRNSAQIRQQCNEC